MSPTSGYHNRQIVLQVTGKKSRLKVCWTLDRLGSILAIAFFVSAILVFISRLLGRPQFGHWIGWFEFLWQSRCSTCSCERPN